MINESDDDGESNEEILFSKHSLSPSANSKDQDDEKGFETILPMDFLKKKIENKMKTGRMNGNRSNTAGARCLRSGLRP